MAQNIAETLSNVELALLTSDPKLIADLSVDEAQKPLIEIANKIIAGDYADVFKVPAVVKIMSLLTQNVEATSDRDAFEYISDNIEDYLSGLSAATRGSDQLLVLLIGVANLLVFLQANWTGPTPAHTAPILAEYAADCSLRELTCDGEVIYKKLSYLQQLQMARAILVSNGDLLSTCASRAWWTARVALMQQHVMSGPCDTLRRAADVSLSKAEYTLQHWPVSPERALFTELRARLFLEHGRLMYIVGDTTRAREYYDRARDLTGLVAELSGVHGKRTRFQEDRTDRHIEFTTPQLVVLATSEVSKVSMTDSERASVDSNTKLPIDVPHESDVLLPRTDFGKAAPEIKTQMEQNLAVIDQCILLAIIMDLKSTNPREELTAEQMTAYVNRLVLNPNNWMVHSTVLLLRSRIEADKSKTMDRAVLQLQSLADQYDAEDQLHYTAAQRVSYIYSLPYPPCYKLKRELALQYLKLGLAKSALQLFEELELWSEIIQCYQVIGDQLRGQQVIEEQLAQLRARRESGPVTTRRGDQTEAELLCLMGDLTGVKDWYEQAWAVSQQSYARAKRQLGHWWVKQGKLDEAIPHFDAALKINPQYPSIWFTMGFCCMHINKLEMAQICFTRVVGLNPEDGESWNNLAAVCLKLKKYKEAYSALREALKHKNDSYRIWENYMFVSLKINQLQDAIYAYQRVLDKKEKHVDHEVLSYLVDTVVAQVQAQPGEASKFLEKQLAELFGRLTSQVSTDAELWGVYQSFHHRMGRADKALDLRWKQLRSAQCAGWEQDETLFVRVVRVCEELVAELMGAQDKPGAYSLKLNLSSALKKCRAAFEQHADYAALAALLARLEQFAD